MFSRIKGFFHDVKAEFKKVSWPTRPKTVKSAFIVLVLASVLTAFLGAVNTGFIQVVQLVIN